ncbi:hypothetical protein DFR81_10538 [Garciella nitratireducens]|nr:hypothetical protein DFR81_10538 [Garciella nitratireducens]
MVFACGVINILITVTKIRKMIIRVIPESLQNAIGSGIGIFSAKDEKVLETSTGFKFKIDKTLFADSIGTFNTTTLTSLFLQLFNFQCSIKRKVQKRK